MRAPKNRRVFVVGYALSTALGHGLHNTWARAAQGISGTGWLTRFAPDAWVESRVVGEIPDYEPTDYDFVDKKLASHWNARYVLSVAGLSLDALRHAGLELDDELGPRTAHLVGTSLGGLDAYGAAARALEHQGFTKVSPFLLPNVCHNLPSGIASAKIGSTGPIFSPGGACASGNHAITLGARLLQRGEADVALVGGVEFPLVPPIVAGFQNMNATYRVREGDRGTINPTQASRPFSHDARGFVLAEGAGILVLAAEELVQAHGLRPRAEVWGCAMTSDAYHHTKPHLPTIVRCIRLALEDAELAPEDIQHINCHGTSTRLGDQAEIEVLREAFERALPKIPITSTKSMLGHSLGATAAVEAILSIEGMHRDLMLPTVNHLRNGDLLRDDVDVVANEARQQPHEVVLNNAFGFGGTNCCVVLRKA